MLTRLEFSTEGTNSFIPNYFYQVLDMSRSACERTSLMLSRVSRLAQVIEREKGLELDTSGAKVANAAQVLLNNAQV